MGFNPGLLPSAGALSNLLLVTPNSPVGYQPQNAPVTMGIPEPGFQAPAFFFDYEGENTINLQSDITDHYVEDNTSLQDQISLKPEQFTVRGYVGELNDIIPGAFGLAGAITSKLGVVSAFVPGLSIAATAGLNSAVSTYTQATNAASTAVNSFRSLAGDAVDTVQTKQQIAYGQFKGYRDNRTLFTVQTPWQIFQNCAIQNLIVTQEADTNMVTDFEITFKVMKFASTTTVAAGTFQGRANFGNVLITGGTTTPAASTSTPVGQSLLTGGK